MCFTPCASLILKTTSLVTGQGRVVTAWHNFTRRHFLVRIYNHYLVLSEGTKRSAGLESKDSRNGVHRSIFIIKGMRDGDVNVSMRRYTIV